MTQKSSDTDSAPLTRRSFLEQFGLVGGSTLVMSAMRSWDLIGAGGPSAGPVRQAERYQSSGPRRRRLRDGRRIRAREARLQRPHAGGARSGRRRQLDTAARLDAHGARSRRGNTGLQFR